MENLYPVGTTAIIVKYAGSRDWIGHKVVIIGHSGDLSWPYRCDFLEKSPSGYRLRANTLLAHSEIRPISTKQIETKSVAV